MSPRLAILDYLLSLRVNNSNSKIRRHSLSKDLQTASAIDISLPILDHQTMLPLASLMNPDGAVESDPMIRLRPSGMSSTPATPYSDRFPSPLSPEQGAYSHGPPSPPRTAPREVYFHTGQTKGPVNYPPHENLDDHSLAEVRKFRVEPFGAIRETCRHVPYNSNKKDFGAKTGMESLEGTNISLLRLTQSPLCCCWAACSVPAKTHAYGIPSLGPPAPAIL